MSSYISSNDNRLYAAAEAVCGKVPAISTAKRFPAVRFTAKQITEKATRRDKTGTRTFLGTPAGTRRLTEYKLKTYLTSWILQSEQPGYGALFQAALGGEALIYAGGTVASGSSRTRIVFGGSHGLVAGQAVTIGSEIRFVSAVADSTAVQVNAPFTSSPAAGTPVLPSVTYKLAKALPTASIFDFWSPEGTIQRVLCGAAVNTFTATVNADFHEFEFSGPASDLIDSASFSEGDGELTEFPAEPQSDSLDHSIVPGHLGQVWLGVTPERFYTLTSAALTIDNSIEKRVKEFGIQGMRMVTPGQRSVTVDFELFSSDDEQTTALYAAARQRSPLQVMLQLGQEPQQLFGVYLKSVVPEVPEFDDTDTRLAWRFANCKAQGTNNDELVVAFA